MAVLQSSFLTAQNTPAAGDDAAAKPEVKTVYYKRFKEIFYNPTNDEFAEDLAKDTLSGEAQFFAVKLNEENKPLSVGYYTKGENTETQTLKLTQYVNFERLPYYYLTYSYNDKSQVIKKEFKDQNDAVIAYYQYTYHKRTGELEKVEKFGKTPYLGKMEMKSYGEFKWEGENLKTFTFYNKQKNPVEKYTFNTNPEKGENKDPINLVGNNEISKFVLNKYERYRVGTKNFERSYWVQYSTKDNMLLQEKFNHDDVLIEEAAPIEIPQENNNEAGANTAPAGNN